MRTVTVRMADIERCMIPIGFVDENLHTQVRFDCKKMFDEYPAALPSLAVSPPEGSTYPAIVTKDGDFVVWDVTASDCASDGMGEIQLTFVVGEIVAKSYVGRIRVTRSLNPSGEIPDPVQDWITQANEVLGEVEEALTDIPETIDGEFDAITAEASTLTPGSSATASFDSETKVLSIGVPQGAKGEPGDDYVLTEEDKEEIAGQAAELVDLSELEEDVSDLKSQISVLEPAATSSDVGKFLKAKTVSGGKVTEYEFGSGGGGGGGTSDYTDLTNKPQINSVTLSGNKSLSDLGIASANDVAAKYTKPQTGIPASDLASGVIPSVPVQDVQVNGTSVLSQGVANVPVAGTSNVGVVKINETYGIGIRSQDNIIQLVRPSSAQVKGGALTRKAIDPALQHEATFFGLAKAADADMKDISSTTVGVYPEAQKSAISDMLNAPETVSGTTPSITAKSGVRYICGEVSTLTITAPASGCIDVTFVSGSTPTVLTVSSARSGVTAIKWANGFDPTSLDANTTYEINILDGEFGVVGSWT